MVILGPRSLQFLPKSHTQDVRYWSNSSPKSPTIVSWSKCASCVTLAGRLEFRKHSLKLTGQRVGIFRRHNWTFCSTPCTRFLGQQMYPVDSNYIAHSLGLNTVAVFPNAVPSWIITDNWWVVDLALVNKYQFVWFFFMNLGATTIKIRWKWELTLNIKKLDDDLVTR